MRFGFSHVVAKQFVKGGLLCHHMVKPEPQTSNTNTKLIKGELR